MQGVACIALLGACGGRRKLGPVGDVPARVRVMDRRIEML